MRHLSTTRTWDNWYASSVIAEALFASWARDAYGDSVRWDSGKLTDVIWDQGVVDVKDSFFHWKITASGEKAECLGFMGTPRGPGYEAREGVTHYALVVRDVPEGAHHFVVAPDGSMTITTRCHFSIYLVPRGEVSKFFAAYTKAGAMGTGRNRYQLRAYAEQFQVFDNHRHQQDQV